MVNKILRLRSSASYIIGLFAISFFVLGNSTAAHADFELKRGNCTYLCHWYVTTTKCSGPFGVKIPCPVRRKRCDPEYCTQSQS